MSIRVKKPFCAGRLCLVSFEPASKFGILQSLPPPLQPHSLAPHQLLLPIVHKLEREPETQAW